MSIVGLLIFLPIVGALIGYVCKWVAIRMLFVPERWIGLGPIGWQGVVQRRAPKFAANVADTVSRTGVTVEQITGRIESKRMAELLHPIVKRRSPAVVRELVDRGRPGTWDALPAVVQQQIAAQVESDALRIIGVLVDELRPSLAAAIDLRAVVIAQLSGANANRLARLFQHVGRRELQVVIYYGAVLGFIIGLVEVGGYSLIERWWLLPLIGAVDGLVNNWFAIQMIFRPLERTRYLGVFPFQGLFPARQHEIAAEYCRMLATEVLSPRDVYHHVMAREGEALIAAGMSIIARESDKLFQLLHMINPGSADRNTLLAIVGTHIAAAEQEVVDLLDEQLREPLGIAATMESQLRAMTKLEFERLLRGIFEEDEVTLIILGGVLGGLIGLLQGGFVLLAT